MRWRGAKGGGGYLLNGLVGGPILTKEDGVVGEDIENTQMREGGEDHGTIGIADKVEEGGAERDEAEGMRGREGR